MTLIFVFHYRLVSWCKLEVHAVGVPSDIKCVYRLPSKKRPTHRDKFKNIVLAFFNPENCFNKMISVRKPYILLKNLEICWLFDKESYKSYYHLRRQTALLKIIYIYDFRMKFLLCLKWKTFWLQKSVIQILWISSCNKCIVMRLWEKVFVSQVWVQAEMQYIHYDLVLISQTLGHCKLHFWPCKSH